jgi:AraC family transcriptional regulator of adaptative response/methylated-DNA-[protein]-cysteine methyltransferase
MNDLTTQFYISKCWLGYVLTAWGSAGVCAINLGEDPEAMATALRARFPDAAPCEDENASRAIANAVTALVENPAQGSQILLDLRGSQFQQTVWQALRTIPPGQTLSYTELAQRIGAPRAARAVASACAANPVAVAVPCHRVVRSDGSLSGYRWGVERKHKLLAREAQAQVA